MAKSSTAALELRKPELVEAEGSRDVDSLKLLDGGNVRVCFDGMQATDLITLNWPLAGSPYPPIEPQYGVDDGCINFYILPDYIALWLDNFAMFTYTVTRDDEDQTSPEEMVRISLPSNLPQVQILQAFDDKLDLSLLCCEDPVLYIPPWAFAGTLQTITCYLGGIYPDGSKARLYPYKDDPVTEEDVRSGWRRHIPRDVLQQLKHDSELFVSPSVRFSQVTPYRLFPSRVLTLLTESHLELNAANVVQAVECTPGEFLLNPLNATGGATIRVAYDHPCPKDYVCAYWTHRWAGNALFVLPGDGR